MTVQELYASIGGDYEAALKILKMDKMIERFIVKILKDSSYETLNTAWAAGDMEGVFEGAHAMKGICANLGLLKLSDAAAEIADEFREGATRRFTDEEVGEKIAAISAMYEKAVAGIKAFSA